MRNYRLFRICILAAFLWIACGRVFAVEPDFQVIGWQLQDSDEEHIMKMVDLAKVYGVNHIQLSHDIVMNIDQMVIEHKRTALIRRVARRAKKHGMKTYVWSHEFNVNEIVACIDPGTEKGAEFWEQRQERYREALKLAPEIDGIILSFGSAHPDPWALMCTCSWCVKHDNADRVAIILSKIGEVVEGEFGKELFARTFIHTPQELEWVGEGLRETKPRPGLKVMTKDVPQDWEPYYPNNSLIGNVGGHPQIIELDLAGEYWGKGAFPFDMTDYLKKRMLYAKKMGAAGFVARIERGSSSLFGTPNEINLHAYHAFINDISADPDKVRLEWIAKKYGVDIESDEAKRLAHVYEASFDAVRKMYYILGFWALEKGSDLTASATVPKLLSGRSIALYDPAFKPREDELSNPTPETFTRIMGEKAEALDIVLQMKSELENLVIPAREELDKLKASILTLENAVGVWSLANGALWSYRTYETSGDESYRKKAAHFASALEGLATVIDKDQWPGGPDRIMEFIENFRMKVKERIPVEDVVLEIPETPVRNITIREYQDRATVEFFTDAKTLCWLNGGTHLMNLVPVTGFEKEHVLFHIISWNGLLNDTQYYFNINCKGEEGNVLPVTSDYWILTKGKSGADDTKQIKEKKKKEKPVYNIDSK